MASWAGEEFGLHGSYEWVFQHTSKLMNRAVGLVNTDTCVAGPIIEPQASPVFKDIILRALKTADDPTVESMENYYEFWVKWTNLGNEGSHKDPEIHLLSSGTDQAPFAFYASIPAINIAFGPDNKKYPGVGLYPMYHTAYETFYLMDNLIDPGFKIHKTCAQTSIYALVELADSVILPYNLEKFPRQMQETLDLFDEKNVTMMLQKGGVSLEFVKEAVKEFHDITKSFTKTVAKLKASYNPMEIRIVNDQMMHLERIFTLPKGLPGRPDSRNAIFAPSKFNSYAGAAFPGITDLLHEIEDLDEKSKENRYEELKRHVSDLMIMIQAATRFLYPVYKV